MARRAPSEPLGLARFLVEERRLHEAVRCYALVTAGARDANVWWEYGAALLALEDYRGAIAAFERAVGLRPQHGKAWNDRGVALAALGRTEEAQASFARALQAERPNPAASTNLASLHAEQDVERAEALYRAALRDDVGHLPARIGLGRLLLGQRRFAEARLELNRARRRDPYSFDALLAEVTSCVAAGALPTAIEECERYLALSPHHSGALALRAELDRELGGELFASMLNAEDWARVHDLDLRPELLAALVDTVGTHRTLTHAPPHHATRGGLHSGSLSPLEQDAFAELEPYLEEAISSYTPPARAALWWAQMRPSAVALHRWAVLLEGEGFQQPHLHPEAWLSGVVYLAVPSAVQSVSDSRRGYLELGRIDPELGLTQPRPSHFIQPRPGRLVIFPSWLYHSTVPHASPGIRLSLAFDCIRARK